MTIEANLSSIAESLKIIADALSTKQSHVVAAPVAVAQPAPVAPVVEAPAVPNVVTSQPSAQPSAPVQQPTMTTVGTTSAPTTSDFNLTTYVLDAYKKLGPVKGAGIQGVLQQFGAKNINDVKPEQYAAVKAAVDAMVGT